MSSCHLLLGRPLDLFPLLGCHSVHRLVHLLSFNLAIWPAHFHFCFRVYSMISMIFVLFLISALIFVLFLTCNMLGHISFLQKWSVRWILTIFTLSVKIFRGFSTVVVVVLLICCFCWCFYLAGRGGSFFKWEGYDFGHKEMIPRLFQTLKVLFQIQRLFFGFFFSWPIQILLTSSIL